MVEHGILKYVTYLHLKHRLHSPLEKSLIDLVMQYFKDKTENFDDYYPCYSNNQRRNCDLEHVYNWISYSSTCIIQLLEIKFHL